VFADKAELIEEYDSKTLELLLRKRREAKQSGAQGAWEYIQGEDAPGSNVQCGVLRESSVNVRMPCLKTYFSMLCGPRVQRL
jgi:hypothetical protein